MKAKFKKATGRMLAIALAPVVAAGMFAGSLANFRASANIGSTLDPERKYRADYDSFSETEEAAAELNLELMAEGAVLLKNNNTLPLKTSAVAKTKVTVLGAQADKLSTGGGGSGAQSKPGFEETPEKAATLFESLDAANYEYNPSVKERYEQPALNPAALSNGNEYDNCHYMNKVEQGGTVEFDGASYAAITDGTGSLDGVSLSGYDETAIVVLSRTGAEGNDNLAYDLPNMENKTDHYLQLSKNEKELMAYAKANFEKIIVIINSPSAMELGCLEDDEKVGAILWIGQPGWNGIMSVGKILNGDINPSGRTVDFYMRDFATDPTWYNFGDSRQANAIINGEATAAGLTQGSTLALGYDATYATSGVDNPNATVLDYAEGIYMGYRYYETVYAELTKAADKETADKWYEEATVYPFGYGLSYTTFTQEITNVEGDLTDKDGEITVSVKVTNTGSVPGKDVVQLYNTPTYTEGGIEKADVNLIGFEKTGMIEAKGSEEVKITVAVKDLASFDYNGANDGDHVGYELEKGNYVLSIRKNSHEVLDSETLSAANQLDWDEDDDADTPNNIFSQESGAWEMYNTQATHWAEDNAGGYLSRADLVSGSGAGAIVELEDDYELGAPNPLQEQLGWLLKDEGSANKFIIETFIAINSQSDNANERAYMDFDNRLTQALEDDFANVWSKTDKDIPADWTQGTGVKDEKGLYKIILSDMTGVALDDEKWTEFMNQLTWEELVQIVGDGGYGSKAVDSIGKPTLKDHDGPGQLRAAAGGAQEGNGYAWVCESVIGSTWNKGLAEQQGRIVGNESIFLGVNGWYGPAMNVHRNALSGRNFEYYSQDGVHGGYMLASVVKGATDKGMHVYMKHAFLNDQETGRMGTATFATEQAIREIYARPFEIAVKKGNANGMMTSFNRIGIMPSASYGITVQMYENEWGFDGISVTDAYVNNTGWDSEVMIRGHILPLNSIFPIFPPATAIEGKWDASLNNGRGGVTVDKGADDTTQVYSPTQWYWARTTAQQALYTFANGNGLTGFDDRKMFSNVATTVEAGNAYSDDTAIQLFTTEEIEQFNKDMLEIFGSAEKYEVKVEGLPEGFKLDMATGQLTGTAPAAGKYQATITVTGKDNLVYITNSSTVDVNVAALVEFGKEAKVDFNGYVDTSGKLAIGEEPSRDTVGKYISEVWSVEGLPEGLKLDTANGTITGKATNLPSVNNQRYKITLTQTVQLVENEMFGGPTAKEYVYSHDVYITLNVPGASDVIYNINLPGYDIEKSILVNGETIGDIAKPESPMVSFFFKGWALTPGGEILEESAAIPEDTLYAMWDYRPISIIDGNFWIDGVDTGISAGGEDGVGIKEITYAAGEEGTVVTITLTNGTSTEFTIPNGAAGTPGTPGADGADGTNGADGAVGPAGPAGKDGKDASAGIGIAAIVVSVIALAGAGVVAFMSLRKKN